MATADLVGVTTGVMKPLLSKLTKLLEEEYVKLKGDRKRIKFLRDWLSAMSPTLEMLADAEELQPQMTAWKDKLRELSYDLEDCIDAFMARVDHERDGHSGFIKGFVRKLKKLKPRHEFSNQIQELEASVMEASERHKRYDLAKLKNKSSISSVDPRLRVLYEDIDKLVGIDVPKKQIIEVLSMDMNGSSAKLIVVSIVGCGGLGKTTLAKQVYDTIKGQFECAAFVSVSQTPDVKKILIHIADEVECTNINTQDDNERQLIGKLREHLHNKRYIVVIDDVWNANHWEFIKLALPNNDFGSRIIMTTRIVTVANCYSSQVYEMEALSFDDSKRLFFRRAFGSENSRYPHLEDVPDKILRKCGGLPLAIVTVSGILTNVLAKEEWDRVLNTIGSSLAKRDDAMTMTSILSLSYSNLPHHLRACLLYLSVYPEDYEIEKQCLINRWIAEGFIHEEEGQTRYEICEEYFNDLINRSMIQPVKVKYGQAKACRVHGIILDYIKCKAAEENFVTSIDAAEPVFILEYKVRRLCVSNHNKENATILADQILSQVRSVTLFGEPMKISLLPSTALRVLDLGYCRGMEDHHLASIGYLLNLKYLRLHSGSITKLPDNVSKLQHLQTLDVRGTRIKELPRTITKLQQLAHLYVDWDTRFPEGTIGKMHSLEELREYGVQSYEQGKSIQEFSKLTKLRTLEIKWDVNLPDGSEGRSQAAAIHSYVGSLLSLCNLHNLIYNTKYSYYLLQYSLALNSWHPAVSCSIHKLCIKKLPIYRVPNWMGSLGNLGVLELFIICVRPEDVEILGEIPCLLFLNIGTAGGTSGRIVFPGNNRFRSLKYFCLSILFCGTSLEFEAGSMSKLEHMTLEFCAHEMECFNGFSSSLGIQYLLSLNEVKIYIRSNRHRYDRNYNPAEDNNDDIVQCISRAINAAIETLPNRPTVRFTEGYVHCEHLESALRIFNEENEGLLNKWPKLWQIREEEENQAIDEETEPECNVDNENHDGEDKIEIGTKQTEECNADDENHDGEDKIEISIKQTKEGDHVDQRQRINIEDITSGLDEIENNTVKSVMTFASQNSNDENNAGGEDEVNCFSNDENNAGGEDEVNCFGSEKTDFKDQECNVDDENHDGEEKIEIGIKQTKECNADDENHDGEDKIEIGIKQTKEGDHADRRPRLNIGDIISWLDETENNIVNSVTTFASQNDDVNNVDGEGEINVLGSEQTDFINEEGEMSSMPGIIEFPTSFSLGAMGPLLQKLDLLLDSRNQLIRRSAKEVINLLKEDLEEINTDLVELSMEQHPNYKTRYWMHEVRELSYHIEDCIDNMVQSQAAAEAKVRFSGCRPQLRVRRRVKIPWLPKTVQPSARISELRTLLWEARERHERYQLQDCVSSEPRFLFSGNNRAPAVAAAVAGAADYNLVGVDGARGKLTSWLIGEQTEAEQHQLKVLSILGPGGVGKTALVKELYGELGQQFDCRAFVRVSRNPDMKKVLGEILSQVRGRKQDSEYDAASTADNLMDSIRSHLQDKRYFVVIDELWDAAAWDIMNIAFPKGNNCSRIIITAEGKDVASKCYWVHKLEMAPHGNPDDSEKIFFDRVFGSEHQCPDQPKDISCMIIRSCGGFPLAITTVASLLASQIDNTELWDYLQQCFVSRLTGVTLEETCKEVVNICYDALPQDLKTCLLYLTMYPEGSTIRKADLLNQWIAEGFITPKEENQAVAESYFAELIRRGMIQPEKLDHNDEVLSCTVHHIVFDLIAQKSREENFITAVDYSQGVPGFSMIARRLSLHFSCAQFAAKPEGLNLSHVRSLAFYGLLKCMPSITEFRFLRVLILEFWGDKYHHNTSIDPSKFCILFHLRYLKVSSHIVIVLPSQIRRLKSLETLEIDAQVSAVPTDILHLPILLHLSLPNGTELPDGIGRITSLRTLEYFDLGNNSEYNTKGLGKLINLQNLRVTCSKALSDHHLKRNLAALSSSVGKLANLKSLRVGPFAFGMTMFIDQDDMPCAPKHLERLELSPSSFILSRLPTWIGALQKLSTLKIAVRVLLSSDIDTLTGLPVLAVLSLYVQKPNAESVVFNSGSLPALKYFKYRCSTVRLGFQKEALPNLRRLKLCFNVHRAESYISNLAGIENLLKLKEITAEIGTAAGAHESDRRVAESALKEATRKHPRFPIHMTVKSVDCIEEESTPARFMHLIPYIVGFLALVVVVVVLIMLFWY